MITDAGIGSGGAYGVVHDRSISARQDPDAVWVFDIPSAHREDLVDLVKAHGRSTEFLMRLDYDVIDIPLLRLTYYDVDPVLDRIRVAPDQCSAALAPPVEIALQRPLPPWWQPKV